MFNEIYEILYQMVGREEEGAGGQAEFNTKIYIQMYILFSSSCCSHYYSYYYSFKKRKHEKNKINKLRKYWRNTTQHTTRKHKLN